MTAIVSSWCMGTSENISLNQFQYWLLGLVTAGFCNMHHTSLTLNWYLSYCLCYGLCRFDIVFGHYGSIIFAVYPCLHTLTLPWALFAAVSHAITRDGSSGGIIRLACITKDGVERKTILHDDLPKHYMGWTFSLHGLVYNLMSPYMDMDIL